MHVQLSPIYKKLSTAKIRYDKIFVKQRFMYLLFYKCIYPNHLMQILFSAIRLLTFLFGHQRSAIPYLKTCWRLRVSILSSGACLNISIIYLSILSCTNSLIHSAFIHQCCVPVMVLLTKDEGIVSFLHLPCLTTFCAATTEYLTLGDL